MNLFIGINMKQSSMIPMALNLMYEIYIRRNATETLFLGHIKNIFKLQIDKWKHKILSIKFITTEDKYVKLCVKNIEEIKFLAVKMLCAIGILYEATAWDLRSCGGHWSVSDNIQAFDGPRRRSEKPMSSRAPTCIRWRDRRLLQASAHANWTNH